MAGLKNSKEASGTVAEREREVKLLWRDLFMRSLLGCGIGLGLHAQCPDMLLSAFQQGGDRAWFAFSKIAFGGMSREYWLEAEEIGGLTGDGPGERCWWLGRGGKQRERMNSGCSLKAEPTGSAAGWDMESGESH